MLDGIVTHVVTYGVDVPVRPPQQPLHPVRRDITSLLSKRPTVLTIKTSDQPGQVLPSPPPRLRASEPSPDPGMQPVQLTRPLNNIDHRHTRPDESIIDTFRRPSALAVLTN